MAQASGTLIGRESELATLERALEEIDGGGSTVLLVSGEPGIGKTRLLRQLATMSESRGVLVLTGSASELERDVPFAVFVNAIDDYVGALDPSRVQVLDDDVRANLAHVFPSLRSIAGRRRIAEQHERHRTYRAVGELLERLSAAGPLALVLDDVHWADPASAELLDWLVRHGPGAGVLLAIAVRPRRRPDRLTAALSHAVRDGLLTEIQLQPLSRTEAELMLEGALTTDQVDALFNESGGNPFYLDELARSVGHLDESATASAIASSEELSRVMDLPRGIASALTEEFERLPMITRQVLDGAAVAGDPFEPELVAAAADRDEATVLDAIDELVDRDLIRETDLPRKFRFRHPLVRRAAYASLAPAWRLAAHERCAAALHALGASAAMRAYHVERSAREGDMAAVAVVRRAGEEAALLAPESATRWFALALRLLPATCNSERAEILLARSRTLAAAGHLSDSRADLLECLALVPQESSNLRVQVAVSVANIEHQLGMHSDSHRRLVTALGELDDSASTEAVELMIALSNDALYAADLDAMRVWATRAVDTASILGNRSILAAAMCMRAWASAYAGDSEAGLAGCDEASELVDSLTDAELAHQLEALSRLASADVYLDRFREATVHARRALDAGRSTGLGVMFPIVTVMLGRALWIQGRTQEASELFDSAVESARLAQNRQSLAWNLVNLSFAALAAGDVDTALSTATEGFDLARDTQLAPLAAFAGAALSAALLENGDAKRSLKVLLEGAGGESITRVGGTWRARFLELLTRALLANERQSEAERAANTAVSHAAVVGLRSAIAMADLATAAVALAANDAIAAAQAAQNAAAKLEPIGAVWDAARARALAGRALAVAGDGDAGAAQLELAAAAFNSFGAMRYRNEVEMDLRRLGRRISHRTRAGNGDGIGFASLTERERQVARLVVDRRTNAEIARQLFLSTKTVETHLRNIFNKMGVERRAELARAVEQADHA